MANSYGRLLSKRNSQLINENEILQDDLEQCYFQIEKLENELDFVDEQFERYEEEKFDLKFENDEHVRTIQRLRHDHQMSERKAEDLKEAVSFLQEEIRSKKREIDRFHDDISVRKETLGYTKDSYKKEIRRITKEKEHEIFQLKSRLDHSLRVLTEKETALYNTTCQLQQKDVQINLLIQNIQYLQSIVRDLNLIVVDLENTISAMKYDRYNTRNAGKPLSEGRETMGALQMKLQQAEQKLEKMETENKKSNSIRSGLIRIIKEEKERSETQPCKVKEQGDKIVLKQRQRIEELEEELAKQCSKLKNNLKDKENQILSLKNELRNLKEKLNNINNDDVHRQLSQEELLEERNEKFAHQRHVFADITAGESKLPINEQVNYLEREIEKRDRELKKANEMLNRRNTELRKETEIAQQREIQLGQNAKQVLQITGQLKWTEEKLKETQSERDMEKQSRQDLERKEIASQGRRKNESNELDEVLKLRTQNLEREVQSRDVKIKHLEEKVASQEMATHHNNEKITNLQKSNYKLQQTLSKLEQANTNILKIESERDFERHARKEAERLAEEKGASLKNMMEQAKEYSKMKTSQTQKIKYLENELKQQNIKIRHLEQNIDETNQRDTSREDALLQRKEGQLAKLGSELQTVVAKLHTTEAELEETKTRLSKAIGDKLTDNNPNIADLSDKNRPVKLAERYSELYDNQWTDAFEVVGKYFDNEQTTIEVLLEMLKDIMQFSMTTAEKQMTDLQRDLGFSNASDEDVPVVVRKNLKDIRKATPSFVMQNIFEMYLSQLRRSSQNKLKRALEVTPFVRECIELCWLMVIQDPPVVIAPLPEGGRTLNTDVYKPYTSSGTTVEYTVWPALLLHEGGPVLAKGVVQGCGKKSSIGKTTRY